MKRFVIGILTFIAMASPVYGVGYGWRWINNQPPIGFWETCVIGFCTLFFTGVILFLLAGMIHVFVLPLGGAVEETVHTKLQERKLDRFMAKQQQETAKQKRGSVSIAEGDKRGAVSLQRRQQ